MSNQENTASEGASIFLGKRTISTPSRMSNQENAAIEGTSISHGQRTFSTPSNIRHRIINGSGTDRRKLQWALLLIVLQTASLALAIFGGNQLPSLIASFILSVFSTLGTAYSVAVSRSDRNVIELVFSFVQFIMTFVHLSLEHNGIKFSPNIESIFPLVLAVTVFTLACKQNEPASSITPDRRKRLLLPLLFIVLETTFLALQIFGGNQLAYLIASFILSVFGFISTAYSVVVSRSDRETERNMIELVFSIVQLTMTYVHLSFACMGIKFSSNIASIFPLVLAITAFALACKQNEPDVERGELENVAPSENLSVVTRLPVSNQSRTAVHREESATTMVPEESQISSGTADTSEEDVTTDSKAATKPGTSSEAEVRL
ncbi:hypothetical protein EZV62_007604 [Acer yangbiense]|uniref:Uncharacterized protein n=1 Tax=Acer yangbiense TaxID=1000413 RepID=A0A5C7IBZ7_9ROSI|nr:hypothetical protein EZV62_007604 [Acer yangbiense]